MIRPKCVVGQSHSISLLCIILNSIIGGWRKLILFKRSEVRNFKVLIALCVFSVFYISLSLISGQAYGLENKTRLADHVIRADTDGLALYPTDKKIIGNSYFSVDEFSNDKEIEKLRKLLDQLLEEINNITAKDNKEKGKK